MKIKELPKIERPREKLIHYGPEKLSDAELLAIIFRTGKKGVSAIDLAKRLLRNFSDDKFIKLNIKDLRNIDGIGVTKACQLVACLELGRRYFAKNNSNLINSPEDIWKELRDVRNSKKEHFVVFYVDSRNSLIRKDIVSIGTLNTSLVHPREVFEPAVNNFAAQIILAHNHPSGDPDPSDDDIEITKRLIKAGEIMGIEVVDHVVVADHNFFSFKEKGLI